jgi:hypothetical protein
MPQNAGLSPNELAIASYVQRAQLAGPTAAFAPLVAGIVAPLRALTEPLCARRSTSRSCRFWATRRVR